MVAVVVFLEQYVMYCKFFVDWLVIAYYVLS